MEKNQFGTMNKKKWGDKFIFFCSLNIWSIFATRKQNGIAKSDYEELQKKSTPDSKWCHSSVGRAMD